MAEGATGSWHKLKMSADIQISELEKSAPDWQAVLAEILQEFSCVTGTIHRTDAATGMLGLLAHQGIPPFVLDKIKTIPFGKGIAGCAAERQEPVQLCNLQIDETGVAKPAARQTHVQGALAVPILMDGKVLGVLGIGKMQPYDFTAEEIASVQAIAEILANQFTQH